MTAKIWTTDEIKALLLREDDIGMHAVGRALLAIYERQTYAEKSAKTTKEWNGVGFSSFDAQIMSSMAVFYRDRGYLSPKQVAFLRACPGKQKTPRICKYAGQLADIAKAKATHALEDAQV